MFTSMITERAMLETILAKHRDIFKNKDPQPCDEIMPGVKNSGFYTRSQIERYVDLENLIENRIRAIDAELARFEAQAPACNTADDLLAMMYGETIELHHDSGTDTFDVRIYDVMHRAA